MSMYAYLSRIDPRDFIGGRAAYTAYTAAFVVVVVGGDAMPFTRVTR